MKVYSLYDKDKTFFGAFPSRDFCITYAKVLHPNADGWDYDIVEEYIVRTPQYHLPYSTLTPSQTIPCSPGVTLLPGTPQINYNESVRA